MFTIIIIIIVRIIIFNHHQPDDIINSIVVIITICIMSDERFKLVFTTPLAPLQDIKDAIFAVGAGTDPAGKYSRVCFQSRGHGQFLPDPERGAQPHIGTPGQEETVEEMRVEILCVGRDVMRQAVEALKRYEDERGLGNLQWRPGLR